MKRHVMVPEEVAECEFNELPGGYKIVWCDEFNYQGEVDNTKWTHEIGTGNGGWGNQESQYYTNRLDNSYVSDGTLKIVAKKEAYAGSEYTSARLVSRNKGDFKYGFIEIRAKLPEGKGTWPALWMMPSTSEYGGWPNSGEIDIMEAVGYRPNTVMGTLHSGAYYGGNGRGKTISVSNTSSSFNLYQLEWDEDHISFLVNGNEFFTLENNPNWKTSEKGYMYYPYDQKFFMIMNVAMGGTLGKVIDPNFSESQMEIDYVRVYEKHDEDDTTVPETPILSNHYATSSTIHLEWEKVIDNIGVQYYEVIVDNKQVAATTKLSYTLSDLKPDKTYKVQLIAVDWKGNYSISQKYVIKTLGLISIPGIISATAFSNVDNAVIVTGTNLVLKMKGNSSVSYDLRCEESTNYSLIINASVLKQTDVKIFLVKQNQKTEIASSVLKATYGSYKEVELLKSLEINSGDYTLIIEAASSENIDSLLLESISIQKVTQ